MPTEEVPKRKNKSGIEPIPEQYRMTKRWIIAKRRTNQVIEQLTNEAIEAQYLRLIDKVKQLLTNTEQPVFIRDYKHDNTENSFALHALVSSTIYLYLECDFTYNFQVECAYNACTIKAEVRELLSAHPFEKRVKEVALQPDFNTFYKTVLLVQDTKYIHYL